MYRFIRQPRFIHLVAFLTAILLALSCKQTASIAHEVNNHYSKTLSIQDEYTVKVSARSHPNHSYSIKVFKQNGDTFLSARTRPMSGFITDVLVEDLNDDHKEEVIVMMESIDPETDQHYLLIDAFYIEDQLIRWHRELPKNTLGIASAWYASVHEIPHNLAPSSATLLLPR